MKQKNYLSILLIRKLLLITMAISFHFQILFAYGMEKSSSDEEYEHSTPKKLSRTLPRTSSELDLDTYAIMLNEASPQKAKAILKGIPSDMKETVLNKIEKMNSMASSSSSSTHLSLNHKLAKKRKHDGTSNERDLELRNKKILTSNDEDNHGKRDKRKSIKDDSLRNSIKSKKPRTSKSEDFTSTNSIDYISKLPVEIIVKHILEPITDIPKLQNDQGELKHRITNFQIKQDMLNYRLINSKIKSIIDKYISFPLSL